MRGVYDNIVEEALRELADEAEQRRLWLSSGGEVGSFEECYSHLYDDSGLGDALESDEIVYTPGIDARFRELDRVLARVDQRRTPQEVIADPVLAQARMLARELLEKLGTLGADLP